MGAESYLIIYFVKVQLMRQRCRVWRDHLPRLRSVGAARLQILRHHFLPASWKISWDARLQSYVKIYRLTYQLRVSRFQSLTWSFVSLKISEASRLQSEVVISLIKEQLRCQICGLTWSCSSSKISWGVDLSVSDVILSWPSRLASLM